MRLNGLGAPVEITLVPVKKEETSSSKIEDRPRKKIFRLQHLRTYKTVCKKTKCEKLQETRKQNGKTSESSNPKLRGKTFGKTHEMETVGTLPTICDQRDNSTTGGNNTNHTEAKKLRN